MKIIVYTILKNELQNIKPWLENVKQADRIYLLDTGSTDGSWELLNNEEIKNNYPQLVIKQHIIDPWRFDTARNENLKMVFEDEVIKEDIEDNSVICWTIDLDERFIPEWYSITENAYKQFPTFRKLRYLYAHNHDENGVPIQVHYYDKCHRLKGAHWSLPIHEIMTYGEYENLYDVGDIQINEQIPLVHHYQNKETDRESYKKLIMMRIQEDRYDLEAMNHLCTEYIKDGDLDTTLDIMAQMYIRGIQSNCNWIECICGNIADIMQDINYKETCQWYEKAIDFNPKLRTYYLKYATYLLYNKFEEPKPIESLKILSKMEQAETVQQDLWKELSGAYSYAPFEIFGLANYYLGDYAFAKDCFLQTLNALPENIDEYTVNRISSNLKEVNKKLGIDFENL